MDKKALFSKAWSIAREAAARLGTTVRAQFGAALKAAWAAARTPATALVMDDRAEAAFLIKSAAEKLGLTVTCGALGVRALVAKCPSKRDAAERLLARQGFYAHEARLHTGVVNSLRRDGETMADHARRNVTAAEALVAFLVA